MRKGPFPWNAVSGTVVLDSNPSQLLPSGRVFPRWKMASRQTVPCELGLTTMEEMQQLLVIPGKSEVPGLSPCLSFIVRRYQQAYHIVGEEKNIAHVFLTAETRHLKPKD